MGEGKIKKIDTGISKYGVYLFIMGALATAILIFSVIFIDATIDVYTGVFVNGIFGKTEMLGVFVSCLCAIVVASVIGLFFNFAEEACKIRKKLTKKFKQYQDIEHIAYDIHNTFQKNYGVQAKNLAEYYKEKAYDEDVEISEYNRGVYNGLCTACGLFLSQEPTMLEKVSESNNTEEVEDNGTQAE